MNPYEILGIEKDASPESIKKSYKDLCKKHHPDKGGSEEKFKEIASAYEILSDPKKKEQYDTFGDSKGNQFGGGNPFGGFDDILSQFFGQNGFRQRQKKGNDEMVAVRLTMAEIMTGANKNITYNRNIKCEPCKGEGGENSKKCETCSGTGHITNTYQTPFGISQQQSKCNKCSDGYIIENPCKNCNGSGVKKHKEEITITIPAGVSTGHMSMEGAGNEIRNGVTGNLIIKIEEIPEPNFVRDGNNIYTDIWVSITDAVLGTQKIVKTPITSFKFLIEPGCESGKIYNFNGRGIPRLSQDGRNHGVGNLYVKVNVTIPKTLSKEQKYIFEELKSIENVEI